MSREVLLRRRFRRKRPDPNMHRRHAHRPPTLYRPKALMTVRTRILNGMLTLSGGAGGSMVGDVGRTMMDIGKRIERGLALNALPRAMLIDVRSVAAEHSVIESAPGGV